MAEDEIKVSYASGEARLLALIKLEEAEASTAVTIAPKYAEHGSSYDSWVMLDEGDVKSAAAFTKLLDRYARGWDHVSMWCYEDVWLDLLELLDLRPPFTGVVKWPRERRRHER